MKRRADNQKPTAEDEAKRPSFGYRAGAWAAGILAVVLASALGGWLTDWGKSFVSNPNRGPALSAIVDVDNFAASAYVLAEPVTSTADRVTLESGTAGESDIMALIQRHGGAAVTKIDATIVLEGRRSSLRIVDIRPRPRPVKKVPAAAFLAITPGGSEPTIPVSVDFGHGAPVFMGGSRPYFRYHQIDLTRGERTTLAVTFTATAGYHEFDLVVTYVTGGKQFQQTIPGPTAGVFRLAARSSDYHTYGTVYEGSLDDKFTVAGRQELCSQLFRASRGC
ncbi:hypothetical protein NE234_08135 [Actinoallomurus sp. WRP9H-5]|nr:hypothetical protein [Actinoallomurus rhizosphaericola]